MAPIRIHIVGAGTAGPLLALALARSGGFAPTLFDAVAAFDDVGAGFNLSPNGLRLVQRLGLLDRVIQAGVPLRTGHIRTLAGTPITAFDGRAIEAAYNGLGNLGILRSRFHAIVANQAVVEGVPVHRGKRLVGLTQNDEGVTITFADGTTAQSDLVVGCDGLRSATRQALFGPDRPRFTGMEAVVGLTHTRHCEAHGHAPDDTVVFQGNGAQFGLYGVAAETILWFITQAAVEEDPSERWDGASNAAQVRDRLSAHLQALGAAPLARQLVDHADRIIRYAIYDRAALPKWTRGRVVLLGDAAHPMSPHLGQGANTALEDAGVLSELLIHAPHDHLRAFQLYEQLRQPRTAGIQRTAALVGKLNALKHPWLCWARDAMMAKSFAYAGGPPTASLYSYDYRAVVDAAVGRGVAR